MTSAAIRPTATGRAAQDASRRGGDDEPSVVFDAAGDIIEQVTTPDESDDTASAGAERTGDESASPEQAEPPDQAESPDQAEASVQAGDADAVGVGPPGDATQHVDVEGVDRSNVTATTPDGLQAAIRSDLGRRKPVDLPADNSAETTARLVQAAKVTTAQHRARGGGRMGGPPPRPPDPLEIDPVPTETANVLTARNARLSPLSLPAPKPLPNRTVPTVIAPEGVGTGELDVELELDTDTAADVGPKVKAKSDAESATYRKAVAEGKQPVTDEPAPLPVAIDPPVLLDVRQPDPPDSVVPAAQGAADKANVARALARLLQDVDGEVQAMIDTSRSMAFPGNKLANAFPEVSDKEKPPLAEAFTTEMNNLAKIAGLAVEEIQAAVTARAQEVADAKVQRLQTRTAFAKAVVEELSDEARKQLAKEARARARDEARRLRRLKSALWSRNPEIVNELFDLRMTVIDADVSKGVLAHERGAKRRTTLLDLYQAAYATAYRKADDAIQAARPAATRWAPTIDGKVWLDVANDELAATFKTLKSQVEVDKTALVDRLKETGTNARSALRQWAAQRTRAKISDEARRFARDADVTRQNKAIDTAKKNAADGAIRNRLLGQVNFAIVAYEAKNEQASDEMKAIVAKMTVEQRKDAEAYLASGGDLADPMAAVAAAERSRFADRSRLTPIAERIRAAVLKMRPTTEGELLDLATVVFPEGSQGMQTRADRLKSAFDGVGTTESTVYEMLSGLDAQQSYMLDAWYGLKKGETLAWRIDDEMSGAEFRKAEALRKNDKVAAAEASVSLADGWFSDDPQEAIDAMAALSPEEAQQLLAQPGVKEKLAKVTHGRRDTSIGGGLRSVPDDRAATQIDLQMQLNAMQAKPGESTPAQERALQDDVNALAMDRAVRDKGGRGDLAAMQKVADQIRAQVSRDPRTADLDDEQFDNEVRRRMRGMELAYERRFAKEVPGGGVSALETAMNWTFLGGEKLDIARAQVHVDRSGQMAGRLQQTTRGLYASDSEVNDALQASYDRASKEVQRSNALQEVVSQELAAELDKRTKVAGRPLGPREVEAYRTAVVDRVTQGLATKYFKEVDTRFGEKYGDQWGGDPKLALRRMIIDSTQFSGEEEALARYGKDEVTGEFKLSGGFLNDAQKVRFGVQGWNMDAKQVLSGIGGKTKEQLAEIAADYQAKYNEDMWGRLRDEAGGGSIDGRKDVSRERFDIDEAKRGVPTNAKEAIDAARRRFEYERDTYAISAEGLDTMATEFARSEASYAKLQSAITSGDMTTVRNAQSAFYDQVAGAERASQAYREAIDAKVDSWVQAITLVVVVAVGAAATFLSGGTLGPVAIAAIASVAGTAATIGTKAALLGNAYGKNQLTDDVVIGALDLAVSIATTRVGNILLKLPKPTGATKAALKASAKQIAAQRAAKPFLARAGAHLAEQVAGSAPTAVFTSLLNRETWKGDPLANVIRDTTSAVAASIVIGGAVSHVSEQAMRLAAIAKRSFHFHFGSGADLHPDRVVLASMREAAETGKWHHDEFRGRGSIEERTQAWKEYKSQFPDATMPEFNRALEHGRQHLQTEVDAAQRTIKAMRTEMLSSIPPTQRAALADTPIVILSAAEFRARTGSTSKGQAVTLVIDGRPVIAVREGAPISALREEGIHVAQLNDPVHAQKLAQLDERRLQNWDSLSIEDRISTWHAKLDLEVDAQLRLIRDLETEIRTTDDPAVAADLRSRLDDARSAHDVMTTRQAELGDLDASALAEITAGRRAPPLYLDEPSRLFSKKKTPAAGATTTLPPPTAADVAAAKARADAEAKYRPHVAAAQAELDRVAADRKALGEVRDRANAAVQRKLDAEHALHTEADPVERARLEGERINAMRELRGVLAEYQSKLGLTPGEVDASLRGQGVWAVHKEFVDDLNFAGARVSELKGELDDLTYKLRPDLADDRLPLGGRYYDVPSQGGEVNHIPPDSVNGMPSYGKGAALRMDKLDHRALTSTDNSLGPKGGLEWRAKQARLIAEGKYLEAIKMDLDEIRAKHPGKYEKGIQQMLDYIEFDPTVKTMNRNSMLTINDLRNPTTP